MIARLVRWFFVVRLLRSWFAWRLRASSLAFLGPRRLARSKHRGLGAGRGRTEDHLDVSRSTDESAMKGVLMIRAMPDRRRGTLKLMTSPS